MTGHRLGLMLFMYQRVQNNNNKKKTQCILCQPRILRNIYHLFSFKLRIQMYLIKNLYPVLSSQLWLTRLNKYLNNYSEQISMFPMLNPEDFFDFSCRTTGRSLEISQLLLDGLGLFGFGGNLTSSHT